MKVIDGNIIDITKGIIVHQVNCKGAIGAGVSGTIISKYPEVEKDYHNKTKKMDAEGLLGSYFGIKVSDNLIVVNSFTQLNYGNSAKTGIVYTNMPLLISVIRNICNANKDKTIYVPYGIGCGLAGGDWKEFETGVKGLDNLVAVRRQS